MRPLFHLDSMLSQYQPVFNYNNFTHFQTYVKGLIDTPHRGTMTQIYQSTRPPNSYWTLAKFLSRSKWDIDEVTSVLIDQVLETELGQGKNKKFVYVYDESHSTTDGTKQHGGHYYINTRYNGRNKNQSKFHHGHQFGAIGWLCETPEGVELFPLAARVMCPGEEKDTSQEVLSSLCDKVPPGLIVFDRGFNRRKVLEKILSQGHDGLCRARSNAVFESIPKPIPEEKRERGRPLLYGGRVHLPYLKYRDLVIDGETCSVADKVVRTRMCPEPVRLIVKREKPKPSKPYKYFLLFTSDLELPVADAITHYGNRWKIETTFRDVKQNFGFGTYQVRNRESLNRHVQLSFIAASLIQLCCQNAMNDGDLDLDTVLQILGIHWYKPKQMTRGLIVDYLQYCFLQEYFFASNDPNKTRRKC